MLNYDFIQFTVTNAGGTSNPLRVTIVWTDPAGPPQPVSLDPTNLVLGTDLDLRVIGPGQSGPTNFPWVLNPNNPTSAATRADNFRDNVEQVHISSPMAGWYRVSITNKGVLSNGYQNVSIIVSGNRPAPTKEAITDFNVWPSENRYIQWNAEVGRVYRVESIEDGVSGVWTTFVGDVSAAKTNLILTDFPMPQSSSAWFRIRGVR